MAVPSPSFPARWITWMSGRVARELVGDLPGSIGRVVVDHEDRAARCELADRLDQRLEIARPRCRSPAKPEVVAPPGPVSSLKSGTVGSSRLTGSRRSPRNPARRVCVVARLSPSKGLRQVESVRSPSSPRRSAGAWIGDRGSRQTLPRAGGEDRCHPRWIPERDNTTSLESDGSSLPSLPGRGRPGSTRRSKEAAPACQGTGTSEHAKPRRARAVIKPFGPGSSVSSLVSGRFSTGLPEPRRTDGARLRRRLLRLP